MSLSEIPRGDLFPAFFFPIKLYIRRGSRIAHLTKKAGYAVLALFIVLANQNCDHLSARQGQGPNQKSHIGISAANGGQPYDGKPFIVPGLCADGTLVDSRIVPTKDGGVVYREACRTINPRKVSKSEIEINSAQDNLIYKGRNYSVEKPAIPLPGVISWVLQLTGLLRDEPADIYIIDMFGNDAAKIQALKDSGRTVLCMMSAGTAENWNPDYASFTNADKGNQLISGERWVDIRSANVRAIMLARMDLAKQKGCHGINFDAVDGFVNTTGFPLTKALQLEYNQFLAFAAHDRHLIMALNGVADLAEELSGVFELAVAEQCFQYGECGKYQSFITRGKPVLAYEYTAKSAGQCAQAASSLISLAYLSPSLDGSRYETCQRP